MQRSKPAQRRAATSGTGCENVHCARPAAALPWQADRPGPSPSPSSSCSVDFNTLERDHKLGAQAPQGSVHTPADRLIWAVSTFFDCFGALVAAACQAAPPASACAHEPCLARLPVASCTAGCESVLEITLSVRCAATGLANIYFGMFFLFGECERLIKWMANMAPNAAFKKVNW